MKPAVYKRAELVAILRDIAYRIEHGDSFEGHVEYSYWDEHNGAGEDEFSAIGVYRIGNIDGQGGCRFIGDPSEKVGGVELLDSV